MRMKRRSGMAEAKLAPNLPDWMVGHANRYLSSGGTDGQIRGFDIWNGPWVQ
jgi:hypothetical protein